MHFEKDKDKHADFQKNLNKEESMKLQESVHVKFGKKK